MSTIETCKTCAFRQPDERAEYINHGYCRRYPPQIVAPLYNGVDSTVESCWPWVEPTDWCGEWRYHGNLPNRPGSSVRSALGSGG